MQYGRKSYHWFLPLFLICMPISSQAGFLDGIKEGFEKIKKGTIETLEGVKNPSQTEQSNKSTNTSKDSDSQNVVGTSGKVNFNDQDAVYADVQRMKKACSDEQAVSYFKACESKCESLSRHFKKPLSNDARKRYWKTCNTEYSTAFAWLKKELNERQSRVDKSNGAQAVYQSCMNDFSRRDSSDCLCQASWWESKEDFFNGNRTRSIESVRGKLERAKNSGNTQEVLRLEGKIRGLEAEVFQMKERDLRNMSKRCPTSKANRVRQHAEMNEKETKGKEHTIKTINSENIFQPKSDLTVGRLSITNMTSVPDGFPSSQMVTLDGIPVSGWPFDRGSFRKRYKADDGIKLGHTRWQMLLHLYYFPEIVPFDDLQHTATLARVLMDRSKLDAYLVPNSNDWLGSNEFEKEATFKKFVSAYEAKIRKWSDSTTKETWFITAGELLEYDNQQGGFPLVYRYTGKTDDFNIFRTIHFGSSLSLVTHPKLPKVWKMGESEARDFLATSSHRGFFLGMRFKFHPPPDLQQDLYAKTQESGVTFFRQIGMTLMDAAIYQDEGLTKKLLDLNYLVVTEAEHDKQTGDKKSAILAFLSPPSDEVCTNLLNKETQSKNIEEFTVQHIGLRMSPEQTHAILMCQGYELEFRSGINKVSYMGKFEHPADVVNVDHVTYVLKTNDVIQKHMYLQFTDVPSGEKMRMLHQANYTQYFGSSATPSWDAIREKAISRYGESPQASKASKIIQYIQEGGKNGKSYLSINGQKLSKKNAFSMELGSGLKSIVNDENEKLQKKQKSRVPKGEIVF